MTACGIAAVLLISPHMAQAQPTEEEEEETIDLVAAVDKDLAKMKQLFTKARGSLKLETSKVKKARMNCMLDLLELNADDRVLPPSYLLLAGKVFLSPDSPEVKRMMWRAKPELLKKLKRAKTQKDFWRATYQVHDGVHHSFARAQLLEASATQGGGSAYSKFQKAYHAWISERQGSGKSVYSAWTPRCNGSR
jgi:hypothetical protein